MPIELGSRRTYFSPSSEDQLLQTQVSASQSEISPRAKKRPHSREETSKTKRAKKNDNLTGDVEEKLSINKKSSSETDVMQWEDYEHLEHVPLAQLLGRKTTTAKRNKSGTSDAQTTRVQSSTREAKNMTFDDMIDSATSSPRAPTDVDTTVKLDSTTTPNTTVNLADNSAELRVVTPIMSPAVNSQGSSDSLIPARGKVHSLVIYRYAQVTKHA